VKSTKLLKKPKINILDCQKKFSLGQGLEEQIKRTVILTLKSEKKLHKPVEINICLMDNKGIREFNLMYHANDFPTDVLAFSLNEKMRNPKEILADIIISTEIAISNAKIYHTAPVKELLLYVTHAVLHILGYDDNTKSKKELMQKKSEQILSTLKPKA